MFRKYHYLNEQLYRRHVECFIGCIQDKPAAFIAVIHFVHPATRKIRMIHRLVVLPDYQGIGIGKRLMIFVAQRYIERGLRVRIVTSNPALMFSLKSDKNWRITDAGRKGPHGGLKSQKGSGKRYTTAWEFTEKRLDIKNNV